MSRGGSSGGLAGRGLEYQAQMPRFLAVLGAGKVQDAISRDKKSRSEATLPEREDVGEEAPLVIADDDTQREFERQEKIRKVCHSFLKFS